MEIAINQLKSTWREALSTFSISGLSCEGFALNTT